MTKWLIAGLVWMSSGNHAPVLDPVPHLTIAGTGVLELTLTANDPDDQELWFSADGLPPGATLDARTGRLRWYSGAVMWGFQRKVTFRVSDGSATDVVVTTLQVVHPESSNEPPVIRTSLQETVVGGCDLSVPIDVLDPDGDELDLSWSTMYGHHAASRVDGLPPGAVFEHGELRWTPSEAQAARTYHLTLHASDRVPGDFRTANRTITVRVEKPRYAPVVLEEPVEDLVGTWKVIERMDDVPPAPKRIRFHKNGTGEIEAVTYDLERDLASKQELDFVYEIASGLDPQVGTLSVIDHRGEHTGNAYRVGERLVLEPETGLGSVLVRCADPECIRVVTPAPCTATLAAR